MTDKANNGKSDEPASMVARIAVQEAADKLFSLTEDADSEALIAWEEWAVQTYGIDSRRSAAPEPAEHR